MHVDALDALGMFALNAPFVAVALILVAYLVRRMKWLRSPRFGRFFGVRPCAVGLGMAFLFLQAFWQPSLAHAIEARQDADAEEDDEGDPETARKQLHRQLWRIRRGEEVERLVLRI